MVARRAGVSPDAALLVGGVPRPSAAQHQGVAARARHNSLQRDGHAFEFVVTERPEEMTTALGHFFRLHSARASVPGSVRHADIFDSDVHRDFLIELSATLAQRRAVRIFGMRIGGRFVAMRIGFVVDDTLYLYYSGYDPAWAKYSVMTTVVAESDQVGHRVRHSHDQHVDRKRRLENAVAPDRNLLSGKPFRSRLPFAHTPPTRCTSRCAPQPVCSIPDSRETEMAGSSGAAENGWRSPSAGR